MKENEWKLMAECNESENENEISKIIMKIMIINGNQ